MQRIRCLWGVLIGCLCLLLVTGTALAATSGDQETQVVGSPNRKMIRGLVNTTFGWTMMLVAPVRWWNAEILSTPGWTPNTLGAVGFLMGVPIGILEAGRREVWGVIETLTFPVPWPKASYDSPYGALGDFPWAYDPNKF